MSADVSRSNERPRSPSPIAAFVIENNSTDSASRHNTQEPPSVTSELLNKQEETRKPSEQHKGGAHHQQPSRWDRLNSNTWAFEALAMAFSLASLIAIVAVLWVYDNEPAHAFLYGLTLNTIISTSATASKASLLCAVAGCIGQLKWCWFRRGHKLYDLQRYDNASRGPAGAMSLLFGPTWSTLAGLGAIITVLAVIFDPFVQQLITYPSRSILLAGGVASTRKSSSFATVPDSSNFTSAVWSGLWSKPSQFGTRISCSSGDCDWPEFQSLGWCAACVDAKSMATINFSRNSMYFRNSKNATLSFGHGEGVAIKLVDVEVGSGGPLEAIKEYNTVVWAINQGISTNYTAAVKTTMPPSRNLLASGLSSPPPLTMGRVSINHTSGTPEVEEAEQCTLTPCLRTYKIHATKGIPETLVKATDYGYLYNVKITTTPDDFSFASQKTACWQPTKRYLNWTSSWQQGPNNDDWMLMANQTNAAFCLIADYGREISLRLSASDYTTTANDWEDQNADQVLGVNSRDVLNVVLAHNLTYVFNNIAASLTNLALDLDNQTVVGTVKNSVVYVSVRWPWFIFPALLEIFGLLLFITTVIRTHHGKVALWRSSLLPLLYRANDVSEIVGDYADYGLCGMELTARMTTVRLASSQDHNGDVLKEVSIRSSSRDYLSEEEVSPV